MCKNYFLKKTLLKIKGMSWYWKLVVSLTLVVTALNQFILTWKSFKHQVEKSWIIITQFIAGRYFVVNAVASFWSFPAIIEKALSTNGEIFFLVTSGISIFPKSFIQVLLLNGCNGLIWAFGWSVKTWSFTEGILIYIFQPVGKVCIERFMGDMLDTMCKLMH